MWSILGEYVIQQKAVLPVSGPMFTVTVSTDPHRRCWCLQSPFRAPLTGRRLNCSKQQQWNSVKLSYTSWGTSRRPQWWSEGKRAWMQRSCSVSPGFTSGADRFLLSVQDCCSISQLGVDTARFFHHKTNILMSKCDKFGKRHASPSILNTAGQRAGDSQLVGITPVACVSVSVIQKSKSKSVYGDMRGLSLTPNPDDLWFGDFRAWDFLVWG